jgi:hypothetical protein
LRKNAVWNRNIFVENGERPSPIELPTATAIGAFFRAGAKCHGPQRDPQSGSPVVHQQFAAGIGGRRAALTDENPTHPWPEEFNEFAVCAYLPACNSN